MIITKSGITIRMHLDTIRTMGRAAQGVRLINLKGTAAIAAVARVPRNDEEEDEIEYDENGDIIVKLDTTETGTDIENDGESEENEDTSVE